MTDSGFPSVVSAMSSGDVTWNHLLLTSFSQKLGGCRRDEPCRDVVHVVSSSSAIAVAVPDTFVPCRSSAAAAVASVDVPVHANVEPSTTVITCYQ